MKLYILPLLIISFVVTSCGSSSNDENKNLQDSVIAVHDEIMPLMGGFVRNSIKIDSILMNLPEIKMQNPEIDTNQTRVDLLALKENLDSSTESMNDWMHGFEVDHAGKTKEEVKNYLESELLKINEVKRKFEAASEESQTKLKAFQN
jgi:hypothetical protein